MKKIIIVLAVLAVLAAAGYIYFATKLSAPKNSAPTQNSAAQTGQTNVGLANPASVYCEKNGGKLVIQKKPDGGEYGLCYFEDNRACEEWELMRGDCAIGGMKTTGYDTDEQRYCAWVGGHTTTNEGDVCTFGDNSYCALDALYSGECGQGQNMKK